jgi:hypothetical protein
MIIAILVSCFEFMGALTSSWMAFISASALIDWPLPFFDLPSYAFHWPPSFMMVNICLKSDMIISHVVCVRACVKFPGSFTCLSVLPCISKMACHREMAKDVPFGEKTMGKVLILVCACVKVQLTSSLFPF